MGENLTTKSKGKEVFRSPSRESLMDRTTANAREIVEAEIKKRQDLTVALREARLAKENALVTAAPPKAKSRR